MGILSNIFHKIFPSSHPAVTQDAETPAAPPALAPAAAGQVTPKPAASAAMPQVDVTAILDQMVQGAGQPLNWRTSIVDLLKLLNLDSSLDARRELARELNYKGEMGDSASMNIWLHRQVMTKLAANGGKVPADLAN